MQDCQLASLPSSNRIVVRSQVRLETGGRCGPLKRFQVNRSSQTGGASQDNRTIR